MKIAIHSSNPEKRHVCYTTLSKQHGLFSYGFEKPTQHSVYIPIDHA